MKNWFLTKEYWPTSGKWMVCLTNGITKGHNKVLGGDRYIHYLDCGDSFMGVCICQKLSNQTL